MNRKANSTPLTFERLQRQFRALQHRSARLEAENKSLRQQVATKLQHEEEALTQELLSKMLADACQMVDYLKDAKQELEEELERLEAREAELEAQLAKALKTPSYKRSDFNAVDQLKARLRAIREEREAKLAA